MSEQKLNLTTLHEIQSIGDRHVENIYSDRIKIDVETAAKLETAAKIHAELNEAMMDIYVKLQKHMGVINDLLSK